MWTIHRPTALGGKHEAMTQKVEKEQRRRFNGLAIYIMWNP